MSLSSSGSCSFTMIAAVVCAEKTDTCPKATPARSTTPRTPSVMSMNPRAREVVYSRDSPKALKRVAEVVTACSA